jgi:hypothetical protein
VGDDNAIADSPLPHQASMYNAAALTPSQPSPIEWEGFRSVLTLRADEVIK